MDGRCERHQFEAAADLCDHCGLEFCTECLVRPFGAKRPPICIPCTIANSGLRVSKARPKRKQSRKERKEAAAGLGADVGTPPAVALASTPTVKPVDEVEPEAPKRSGRRGRKKSKGDDAPADEPTPVVASSDDDEGSSEIPSGAGMPAPGADQIDWSKPFEISS